MNWLTILNLIIQLLPTLIQAIVTVEQAIGPGNGAAKKTLVTGIVNDALGSQSTEMAPHVSTLIDNTVSAMNTAGKFQKLAA